MFVNIGANLFVMLRRDLFSLLEDSRRIFSDFGENSKHFFTNASRQNFCFFEAKLRFAQPFLGKLKKTINLSISLQGLTIVSKKYP